MRYLRMLSNSAFAGILAAVYLTLLVLYLNPAVEVAADAVTPILTVMVLTYGAHIAVVSYVLYVIRQIAVAEPSSPGWISLRLLTWSAAALSGTAAVIMWLHASGLQNTLAPAALPRLAQAAILFAGAGAAFLLLAIAQGLARDRRRATVAILFTVATIASIVIPFATRGPALRLTSTRRTDIPFLDRDVATTPRVLMLCLDGASLDVISPAVASGRLPNFGRILDRGASMHLATTRPTQAEPAWGSIVTGKWPSAHGVRGAAGYRAYMGGPTLETLPDYLYSRALVRFGFFDEEPQTSAGLQAQPIWRILATQGMQAGVIGLPLTFPVDRLPGFVVADRFHRQRGRRDAVLETRPVVYPPQVEDVARAAMIDEDEVAPSPRTRIDPDLLSAAAADSLATDRLHHRLLARLGTQDGIRLLAVRFPGLDAIGHHFLRYAQPDALGNVTDEERRIRGRVLDDCYAYVDAVVGDALAMMRDGDLLLVVSAFGMEPLSVGKRMLERVAGDPYFGATHEGAPDGFAIAYGDAVTSGRLTRGSVVDVAPTLLYFLGLPVARDMNGFTRTDMFSSVFNGTRTITFIPTYEIP